MQAMKAGLDVCVTVTLLDGVVLARSTFHHDMLYRCVVVHGRPQVQHLASMNAFSFCLASALALWNAAALKAKPP